MSRLLRAWIERGAAYAFARALVRLNLRRTNYRSWCEANDTLSAQDILAIKQRIVELPARPTVSLIVVATGRSGAALRRTVESLRGQIYESWEIRIVDIHDGARVGLSGVAGGEPRIVMTHEGGGLAAQVNRACDEAAGELIGFLDAGDELAPSALYVAVDTALRHRNAVVLYSDEDAIGRDGQRAAPVFKSGWNPDLFLSRNYFGRLTLYRRSRLPQPAFRDGFDGAEEYDLALRLVEGLPDAAIKHIPFVLAHSGERRDPPAATVRVRVVEEHLRRQGVSASVELTHDGRQLRVRRAVGPDLPKVSIIIPTRDGVRLLKGCIDSIIEHTDYANVEIIVVDNQSSDRETLEYLDGIAKRSNVRVLRFDRPFNYSAINNFAAAHCTGSILAFLNNDILVKRSDWLIEMVSHAQRPEVGAVGAMLYYPDNVVQHAGIILGFGGVAANAFVGLKQGAPGYGNRAEAVQNFSAVTAACMLTRAEVFSKLGGFEEALPVAFNDVDFCLRLRERGYLVTWTPYAELYHLESVTRGDDLAPDKIERFRRDQAYMHQRWRVVISDDPYYNPNLSLEGHQFSLAAHPRVVSPWRTCEKVPATPRDDLDNR